MARGAGEGAEEWGEHCGGCCVYLRSMSRVEVIWMVQRSNGSLYGMEGGREVNRVDISDDVANATPAPCRRLALRHKSGRSSDLPRKSLFTPLRPYKYKSQPQNTNVYGNNMYIRAKVMASI